MICETYSELNEHIEKEHYEDMSRIICRFYRNGNCKWGSNCKFAHAGHQQHQNISSNGLNKRKSSTKCRNGQNCRFFIQNRCNFNHNYHNFTYQPTNQRNPQVFSNNNNQQQFGYINNGMGNTYNNNSHQQFGLNNSTRDFL